jgi:hypothetical protein
MGVVIPVVNFVFVRFSTIIRIVYVKLGDAIDSQNVCIVLEGSNSDNSNSSKQQQLQPQHQISPVAAYAHRSLPPCRCEHWSS